MNEDESIPEETPPTGNAAIVELIWKLANEATNRIASANRDAVRSIICRVASEVASASRAQAIRECAAVAKRVGSEEYDMRESAGEDEVIAMHDRGITMAGLIASQIAALDLDGNA